MKLSVKLWGELQEHPGVIVFNKPTTGVILWRLHSNNQTKELFSLLPGGSASFIDYKNHFWIRNVAANPLADVELLWENIQRALKTLKR